MLVWYVCASLSWLVQEAVALGAMVQWVDAAGTNIVVALFHGAAISILHSLHRLMFTLLLDVILGLNWW